MSRVRCLCDTVINLTVIPNRQVFYIVWDPDVETFIESLVTAHQQATSNNENFAIQAYNLFYLNKPNFPEFLECPNCGRLIVFTRGNHNRPTFWYQRERVEDEINPLNSLVEGMEEDLDVSSSPPESPPENIG